MTFIDWSDSEEMLGLLAEFVRDAQSESADRERKRFLEDLSTQLMELAGQAADLSAHEAALRLRVIRDSASAHFDRDPVMAHVDECIEEIDRINAQAMPVADDAV